MQCPKCGSQNVYVQAITETKQKAKKGLVYWLCIGWWWEPLAWLFLTLPKLLIAIFGNHKKTVSKTTTQAICQNCGNRWIVQ